MCNYTKVKALLGYRSCFKFSGCDGGSCIYSPSLPDGIVTVGVEYPGVERADHSAGNHRPTTTDMTRHVKTKVKVLGIQPGSFSGRPGVCLL